MSYSIDEKVVEMRFNNKQFEQGIQTTLKSISDLNKATEFTESQHNIAKLQKSFNGFDGSKMMTAIEGMSSRMSAFGIAGAEVIRRITDSAIDLGHKIASVVAKPLEMAKSGGISRALNIEQAKFQLEGLGVAWDKIQGDIEYGVQDTAYGLDAAAKAASQLVASNVQLGDDMRSALRGISGVAAMTSSSYEDISNIFTTVAGNGKLMTMELRQLSSRGLNIAAELAKQLGKSEQEIREMVTKGKIDFATFSKAMDSAFGEHAKDANNTFEGAMSNVKAALSRIGALFATPFFNAVIKPLNALRKLIDTIKNAMVEPAEQLGKFMDATAKVANKFMKSKRIIQAVGDTTQGVMNVFKYFGKILQNVAAAFITVFPPKTVTMIQDLAHNFLNMTRTLELTQDQMDKIQNVARGVFSVFSILGNVIGLFFDIVKDIAKSKAGNTIGKIVQAIANGLQNLDYFIKVIRAAYNYASEAFGGIGGVIRNFGTVVDMVMSVIGKDFTTFGDIIAIIKGDIAGTSNSVTRNIARITKAAKEFAAAVTDKLGLTGEKLHDIFKKVGEAIGSTSESFDNVKKKTGFLGTALKALVVVLKVAIAIFATLLQGLGDLIRDLDIGKLVEEGITLVIIEQLSTMITKIQNFLTALKGGFTDTKSTVSSLKGTLSAVSGAFNEFQKSMQIGRIVQIAAAVAMLSISLYGLSKIGSLKELGIAITGLASISSVLLILSKAFRQLGDGKFIKRGSVQIIIMAAAISILAGAMVKLSVLNFEQVENSSIALAAAMAVLVGAFNMMASTSEKGLIFTKSSKKWVQGAFNMILMAEAIKVLANVIVKLGQLDVQQLAFGMIGLAAATSALAFAFNMMSSSAQKGKIFTKSSKQWVKGAFQMILMAEAINVLAGVIIKLGQLNPQQLAIGTIGLAVSVKALSVAFNSMASSMSTMTKKGKIFSTGGSSGTSQWIEGATQLFVMAAAIKVLSSVIIKIGQLDPQQLATGIIGLAASVAAIVVAFNALSSASVKLNKVSASTKQWVQGATKLVVMAAAIKLVSTVISKLSGIQNMDQGILGLGVAIGALVAAAYALNTYGGNSGQLLKGAAAMVIVASALGMVAGALTAMSYVTSDELPVVLAATVGPLLALSVAANSMNGAVKGAAAMVIVAAAFDLLTPAIILLGSANIESVANALMILGGVVAATAIEFAVMGVAAKIFSKSATSLLMSSTSLMMTGLAFLTFAAGLYVVSKAVDVAIDAFGKIGSGVSNAAEGAGEAADGFFSSIGKALTNVVKWLGKAFKTIGNLIKKSIPTFVTWAMDTIIIFIESMAEAIDEYLPRLLAAIKKLGLAVFKALKETFGDVFQEIEKIDLVKIGAIVIGIALLLKTLASSITSIKPSNIAGALVLVAGVIGISIALIQLSAIPWDNLMMAVASMSTCMIGLTLMLRSLSETSFNVTSLASMIIGAATLIVIAKALEPLAQLPWSSLLAASASLSGVLVAYGLIFKMISTGNMVSKSTLANIGIFALGTLALLPIAAALKYLAESDWQNLLASAASLTATMLGYAYVFKVMSMIPISAALTGLGSLAIAIGGLTAILAALGGIKQIPGAEWLIGEGAAFAQQLGDAIGGFVGSIVAGFGKAISSMLPQIGLDLSQFMVNAMPFFVGVKAIGDDTMSAVKSLAEALILLTAAELVQGIANFFGADNDFKKLGEQLSDFADGMVEFANKTKGIDAEGVEAAANAAKMLGEFANSVPLTGGFLGDLMGNRDLSGFAEALPTLGDGLAKFAKKVGKLDNEAVEAAANSAKMLAELNTDVPLQGGLLGDILGNRRLDDFGEQLPALGSGLAKFAKKTKKLDTDSVEAATKAAEMLSGLNQNIPLQGGLLGDLMGNRDLSGFGNALPDLGEGLKGFADKISGVNTSAATDAATVAGILAELANNIPNTGGLKSLFSGDASLSDFGDELPDLGEGVKGFSDNIDGINSTNISSAGTLLSSIIDVIKKVKDEDAGGSNMIGDFGKNLEELGKAYKAFITYANTSATGLDGFGEAMDKIVDEIKKISKVDTSKLQGFSDDIRSITEVGIKDIVTASESSVNGAVDAVNNKASSFKSAASTVMDALKEGISSNTYKVKEQASAAATEGANAINSDTMKAKFSNSGKNMAQGFADGMKDNDKMKAVVEAAKNMAKKAKKAVDDELDIHSPSKVMEQTGSFTVQGFVGGITDQFGKVVQTGKDLVSQFTGSIDFGSTAGQGASSFDTNTILEKLGLGDKGKKKTKKKAKKDGKEVGEAAAAGVASSAGANEKAGRSAGSAASKGVKFGAKDLKKAMASYSYIMGDYIKQGKAFNSKFINAVVSKKGNGTLKVLPKYLLSGIDNKYLRTAAANLGSSAVKEINAAMRKELKKSDKTSDVLKKLDKAGQKLVDARKSKKEAQAVINNAKSSKKAISAAKKDLAAANKDITKYQKQVEKYEKQLKKAGTSIAKNLTQQAIGEMTYNMIQFTSLFNSMGKGVGTTLAKIPSVLSSYLKNVKSSSSYAKGVVNSVSKMFGSEIDAMDKKTQQNLDALNKKLKDAKKKASDARKVLNDDKASKKDQKKAKKQLNAAQKTISNINTKIAAEKKKLGAASVVDKFAERLYFNSDDYKNEVNTVKASTKKIQKIQKAAAKAKKNLNKATKAENKKKYADELKDLEKQYKAEEKILKKSATNIANGPKKALKAYKAELKETLKSMIRISTLDIIPKIQLEGFDKFEKSTNLVSQASVNSDIFAKAVATAGQKFSIFGDITKETSKRFEIFNDKISTGINLLERFTKTGSVEKQALFENADSQLEAYEEFYQGIQQLREMGLSDTIIDDLKSQGPEALNYIRGFLSMSSDEVASYNERVAQMGKYGARDYLTELKQSLKKTNEFQANLTKLASMGLKQELIDEFEQMGAESGGAYVDALVNSAESISELNELYSQSIKETGKSMLEAAEEQYKASLTYNSVIERLKKTALDPAIIKEIEAMGQEEAIAYGESILNAVNDIPKLNELYWKSMSNDKTMRQQMAEANAEAENFTKGLETLRGYGLDDAFIEYVEGLGIEEGMSVIQRAVREFGSLTEDMRKNEVELFNNEYYKSLNSGKGPMEVLLDNLDSQVKGYDEYTANLDTVLGKLGGDSKSTYFKYLQEMGMDGAEYVEALAKATEDQIKRYREMIDAREERNRQERAKSLISSWNEEIYTINNYANNVATLIKRGASQTLIDDLASMDIKDASDKVNALLSMDQNVFSEWNAQYTKVMTTDISKAVNAIVADYAAATGDGLKSTVTDSTTGAIIQVKDLTVKGAQDTAAAQSQAYTEATLATYPELQQTGSNAGLTTVEAFINTIADNIGAIPVTAVVKAFKKGLKKKSVAKKLISAGEAICTGVKTGINNKKATVVTAGEQTVQATYTIFKSYLNKTKGQTVAKNFCNGIHTIFTLQKPILINDAFQTAKGMNDMFAAWLNFSQGYSYGSSMGLGVAMGLEAMASRAEAAAAIIIQAANEAARAKANINSPSKVWRSFGYSMGEGLIMGLDGSTRDVTSSAESLVSDANSALQNSLSSIGNAVSDELNLNPIITPELDLSRVTAQARAINAMMENTSIGATVKEVTADDEIQNGAVTYNFEQNNYSPKALSQLDIYRNTKNQFAQAREALQR